MTTFLCARCTPAFALWILLSTVFGAGCTYSDTSQTPHITQAEDTTHYVDSTFLAEWAQWKAQRHRALTDANGWLTLIGLHWLHPGANTLGADSSNHIVLPPQAPPFLGEIVWSNEGLWGEFLPEAQVQLGDSTVTYLPLQTDEMQAPTVLHVGSIYFYPIARGNRIGLRIRDTLAPTRMYFSGIEYFPYRPEWRIEAIYKPYNPPKPFVFDNVLHMPIKQNIPGRVIFKTKGRSFALDVLDGGPDQLFIIFADQTTGSTTYGGGRYLYAPRPDSTGRLILDFNKAYNPPCAYTEFATCLLPPPQNLLHIPIEAGERYSGAH